MKELNGQGWTIMKLAEAAKKAGIMSIIDVFSTYCLDEGIVLIRGCLCLIDK